MGCDVALADWRRALGCLGDGGGSGGLTPGEGTGRDRCRGHRVADVGHTLGVVVVMGDLDAVLELVVELGSVLAVLSERSSVETYVV